MLNKITKFKDKNCNIQIAVIKKKSKISEDVKRLLEDIDAPLLSRFTSQQGFHY